jgi:hypothetical protein
VFGSERLTGALFDRLGDRHAPSSQGESEAGRKFRTVGSGKGSRSAICPATAKLQPGLVERRDYRAPLEHRRVAQANETPTAILGDRADGAGPYELAIGNA